MGMNTVLARSLSRAQFFSGRVLRRFAEEGFAQLSASLAYSTLLSLVPLIALAFGVFSYLPGLDGYVQELDRFIIRNLLPERSGGMIVDYVIEFSQKAAGVTLFGVFGLLVSVLFLLFSMEQAFNHVWRVEVPRPWWRRLVLCVVVVVMWPFVVVAVGFVTYQAVTVSLGVVGGPDWVRSAAFKLGGLSAAALCIAGMYCSLPNAPVRFADALWAGVAAALGFGLMQKTFALYIAKVPTFALVYGAFAVVPIFLLWLYLSWAVVLAGALVAATLPECRRPGVQE